MPAQGTCRSCCQPVTDSGETLFCKGCGWTVHAGCHPGAKLCPACARPLISPAAAAQFADSRALAIRQAEYRIGAMLAAGAVSCGAAVGVLQLVSASWRATWERIPGGASFTGLICLIVLLLAAAFIQLRRRAIAVIGLLLGTVVAALYGFTVVPSLLDFLPDKLTLLAAAIPGAPVVAGWWELERWRQIPGDSGGIRLTSRESILSPIINALTAALPFAGDLWERATRQDR